MTLYSVDRGLRHRVTFSILISNLPTSVGRIQLTQRLAFPVLPRRTYRGPTTVRWIAIELDATASNACLCIGACTAFVQGAHRVGVASFSHSVREVGKVDCEKSIVGGWFGGWIRSRQA